MNSTFQYKIKAFDSGSILTRDDMLAVEEPLEIQISFTDEGKKITKTLSITMRTPENGNDTELAAGFLFTEGIINSKSEIKNFIQKGDHSILAELSDSLKPQIHKLERHFYTSSSCGVCGKTSIEAVKSVCPEPLSNESLNVDVNILHELPARLREKQMTFNSTGGLHASALFDAMGNLIALREDVGRHNALDKLIGHALLQNMIPLQRQILLLSGRASFELIQKSAMAGINFVCAVGAPSSLAVDLAKERNMTLVGFLRNDRFNVYSEGQSIINFKL